MRIKLIPTSRSRTWVFRLDVTNAPDTKRDYSDHMLSPERLELSFLSINGSKPRLDTVRLLGKRVSGPVMSPEWSVRMWSEWHEQERLPEWIRPIVEEYKP